MAAAFLTPALAHATEQILARASVACGLAGNDIELPADAALLCVAYGGELPSWRPRYSVDDAALLAASSLNRAMASRRPHACLSTAWSAWHTFEPDLAASITAGYDESLRQWLNGLTEKRAQVESLYTRAIPLVACYAAAQHNAAPNGNGAELLARAVELALACATASDRGIYWERPQHDGRMSVELGAAHGAASVASMLGLATQMGVPSAREGLLSLLAWFEHHSSNEPTLVGWPDIILAGRRHKTSDLIWCRGTLGTTIALWTAARKASLEEDRYLSTARALVMVTETLRNGNFCHGASGVAHLYYRAYLGTREHVFQEAANAWVSQALNFSTPKMPLFPRALGPAGWQTDASIMLGTAGPVLTLMCMLGELEPRWDVLYGIDLPILD